MNIVFRIKQIADKEGIKITQLEEKLGASKGVLSRSLKNNTDIQSKWLTLLVENYPQYNPGWLLTGTGEMILNNNGENSNIVSEPILKYGKCKYCEEKERLIKEKEERIQELKETILILKDNHSGKHNCA